MFYFTNKLNANVQKKNLAIALNTYEVVTSEVKKPWRFIKVHFKNLHAQTKFIKPLHIFLAVYYHLVLTGKIKRDLQPVIFDRPFWHYTNIKGEKTP